MRRVVIILIKLGDGDPKKMDLTATIRTLIPVVYRVLRDVTNTYPQGCQMVPCGTILDKSGAGKNMWFWWFQSGSTEFLIKY